MNHTARVTVHEVEAMPMRAVHQAAMFSTPCTASSLPRIL